MSDRLPPRVHRLIKRLRQVDNARRARDRAQVERHVARLISNRGIMENNEEIAARILRYLRTTTKEWR